MNSIPVDALKNIASFLNDEEKTRLVACDKASNSIKFDTTPFDYQVALGYSDVDKVKIRYLKNCTSLVELNKFTELISLSFDESFSEEIKQGDLPESLRSITFGEFFSNGGMPIKKGDLPSKVGWLAFGHCFNNGDEPFKRGDLPDSIESLFLGDYFTNGFHPVEKDSFPSNLRELSFGTGFQNGGQPIRKADLPKRLETLLIDRMFSDGFMYIGNWREKSDDLILDLRDSNRGFSVENGLYYDEFP